MLLRGPTPVAIFLKNHEKSLFSAAVVGPLVRMGAYQNPPTKIKRKVQETKIAKQYQERVAGRIIFARAATKGTRPRPFGAGGRGAARQGGSAQGGSAPARDKGHTGFLSGVILSSKRWRRRGRRPTAKAERPQGAARPWPAAAPATLAPPLRARAADSRSESRGSAHRKPLIGSIFAGALINIKGNGPLFQASRSFVKPSKMHPNLVRFKPLLVHCSIVAENIALMDACEAMACSAFLCLTLNVKTVFHASPAPKTHYP